MSESAPSERPGADGPLEQTPTDEAPTRVLRRLLRFAFIACLGPIVLFALADLRQSHDLLVALWGIKLAELAVLASAVVLLRWPLDRRTVVAIGLVTIGAVYVLSAISAIFTRDPSNMPLISIVVAFGAATLLPWGARPQAALVGIASIATVVTVHQCTGSWSSAVSQSNIGVAVGMGTSIYVAYELERNRRAIGRRAWRDRAADERMEEIPLAPAPLASFEPTPSDQVGVMITRKVSEDAFHSEGDQWTINFDGRTTRLTDSSGVQHLAFLLRHPGRVFHVLDLVKQGSADSGSSPGWTEPALDARARATYQSRLDHLQHQFDQAELERDEVRIAKVRREMEVIIEEVAAALGVRGRGRPAAADPERARLNVTNDIQAALATIRAKDSSLAHHLAVSIKTGHFCSYTPDPKRPIRWR